MADDLIHVVNLPDPKPAVAARNDGGPPVLPTVPDDVVREISSLLGFKDRLALSLASHHIHQVVKPRVEEVVIDESKLPALHGWVFRDPAVRASQLRVLDIAPAKSKDSPHVRQFLEIIKKATNIHTLRCSRPLSVAIWMQNLPAFTHLRHLQLRGCTPKMLESLRLPDTLTELHLSHPPPETVFVFRRILLALSYLQALTTLTLEGLTLPDPDDEEGDDDDNDGNADEDDEDEDGDVDEDGNADVDDDDENEDAVEDEDAAEDAAEDDDEGGDGDGDGDEGDGDGGNPAETSTTSAPVLTSVHTLKLLEMELPPSVDWATAFPALKTVVLEDAMHFDMDAYATTPLHHLVVSGPFENLVPWCVNRLTYVPGFAARDGILLEDICDASYLVTLSLKLLYMSSSVLDAVVNNASDIHLLEIECLGTVLSEVIWVCYEQFKIGLFADLPLRCLSIVAADSPYQAPEDREQCRIEFLDQAFKGVPSLQYVALAEPHGDRLGNLVEKDEYAGNGAPWRWWRVVRDEEDSPVEIREIPGWAGETIRSYLRNADRKAAEHFNDTFVLNI